MYLKHLYVNNLNAHFLYLHMIEVQDISCGLDD